MWRDFDIEMQKSHSGDVLAKEDIEAIKNSISNIWQTIQGERRMVPSFGGKSNNVLFEQLDTYTLNNIKSLLLGALERWESRIIIRDIQTEPNEEEHMIIVKLSFSIRGQATDKIYNINHEIYG